MVVKDEDGWIHRREIMFEGSWYRLSLENCVGDVVFGVLCHLKCALKTDKNISSFR